METFRFKVYSDQVWKYSANYFVVKVKRENFSDAWDGVLKHCKKNHFMRDLNNIELISYTKANGKALYTRYKEADGLYSWKLSKKAGK